MWTDQVNAPTGQTLPQPLCVTGLVILTPLRALAGTPSAAAGHGKGLPTSAPPASLRRGTAESRRFPRGTPWPCRPSPFHFVPLPRLVLPTQAPLFSPGQRCRQRTLQTNRAGPRHRVGPGKPASLEPHVWSSQSRRRRSRYWARDIVWAGLSSGLWCVKSTKSLRNRGDWR